MPFIVVTAPARFSAEDRQKIENACKNAWLSLNGFEGANNLRASDIGGVALIDESSRLKVRIIYLDRGKNFDARLLTIFVGELQAANIDLGVVETEPTELEMWFADPEWATRKEPCHRRHEDGDNRNRGQLE